MDDLIEKAKAMLTASIASPPAIAAQDLCDLPPPDKLPSPWAMWILIGFIRHRARQNWLAGVVVSRLGADLSAIGVAGALGHPDIPQQGVVPGMIEWEYFFHGCGCMLTHRITGEAIDVDFVDGTADYFDRYFYVNYLRSLKDPHPVEKRIIELHGDLETTRLSVDELVAAGLLELNQTGSIRVSSCLDGYEAGIDELATSIKDPRRQLWAAAHLNDWALAASCAQTQNDPKLTDVTTNRAREVRAIRWRFLQCAFADPEQRRFALLGLCELDKQAMRPFLEESLAGEPSGVTSTALEIITASSGDSWHDSVFQLFRRLNPNGSIPEPYIWIACAQYLLQANYQSEFVGQRLTEANSRELGDVALVALEYIPDQALILIRRAIRSHVPADRLTVCAMLVTIDKPWSRQELVSALNETSDQLRSAEVRAALMRSQDQDCHVAVRHWDSRHPREAENGQFISMTEMTLRNCDIYLQEYIEKLHERVLPLRDRLPRQQTRRWWMPWSK